MAREKTASLLNSAMLSGLPALTSLCLTLPYGVTMASAEEVPASADAQSLAEIQVFLPAVLEKGKPAWGSIYGNGGSSILGEQRILINGSEIKSDDYGSFNFVTPQSQSLKISVPDTNGKTAWEHTFKSTARGLLVSDESAADLVDKLDSLAPGSGGEPIISHAPSVVEAMQTIMVLGKNFSGKQGDDDLEIADRHADILAASPRCIVAVSSKQMKIGPIKELRISSHEQSSLPTEVDVCKIDLRPDSASGKKKLKINLMGSTLPALISLFNSSRASLRFAGWRLGTQNVFLSPGGMQNYFCVEPGGDINENEVGAAVISNSIFDAYSLKSSSQLLTRPVMESEEEAELIRLKRRSIALESQISSIIKERQEMLKSGKMTLDEESKLETSEKSASSRLFRVERMLQTRRAVIEYYGSKDYDKLVDVANNGGISSLDSVLANKDLGFTETRLLKVVGKRAEEARLAAQAEANTWNYTRYYPSQSPAALESIRKKYGKRGYVPPPPTMALIAPPAPFRPNWKDLGPMIPDLPPMPAVARSVKKIEKKATHNKGKSSMSKHAR